MATVGHPEWGLSEAGPWYAWGPYLAERAWGTVREDYSADGNAWDFFPHDHAPSRAYRWNEEGLAGISDLHQHLCLALAFWNGRDPILKERIFGLTNPQGNHGEDAKEYWWYVDATPSHSWLRWRYHYPQGAFPYDDLVAENARRSREDPEYELLDTGIFDEDRYWAIEADVREGLADRRPPPDHRRERGARGRHDPRPPDALVPQHVVVGWGRRETRDPSRGRGARRRLTRGSSTTTSRPQPDRAAPRRCRSSARTRRTPRSSSAVSRRLRTRRTGSRITSCTARRR